MQDILAFIIAREGVSRRKTLRSPEDDQRFYDTAAPLACKLHAARQALSRWRHRLPRRSATNL